MSIVQPMLGGLNMLANPMIWVYIFIGTIIGVIVGALPGIGTTQAYGLCSAVHLHDDPGERDRIADGDHGRQSVRKQHSRHSHRTSRLSVGHSDHHRRL